MLTGYFFLSVDSQELCHDHKHHSFQSQKKIHCGKQKYTLIWGAHDEARNVIFPARFNNLPVNIPNLWTTENQVSAPFLGAQFPGPFQASWTWLYLYLLTFLPQEVAPQPSPEMTSQPSPAWVPVPLQNSEAEKTGVWWVSKPPFLPQFCWPGVQIRVRIWADFCFWNVVTCLLGYGDPGASEGYWGGWQWYF